MCALYVPSFVRLCFVLLHGLFAAGPCALKSVLYFCVVVLFLDPTFSFKNNKKMIMAAFYRLVCLTTTLFDYSGKTRKGATLLLCNFPRAAVHSFIECNSQSHSISNYNFPCKMIKIDPSLSSEIN